jgi:hypothetical protein
VGLGLCRDEQGCGVSITDWQARSVVDPPIVARVSSFRSSSGASCHPWHLRRKCDVPNDRRYGVLFPVRQCRLRCRQPCDRHAEGRARHIVQPRPLTELDGRWVAAMFAADAQLEAGSLLSAAFGADLHQHADAFQRNSRHTTIGSLPVIGPRQTGAAIEVEGFAPNIVHHLRRRVAASRVCRLGHDLWALAYRG